MDQKSIKSLKSKVIESQSDILRLYGLYGLSTLWTYFISTPDLRVLKIIIVLYETMSTLCARLINFFHRDIFIVVSENFFVIFAELGQSSRASGAHPDAMARFQRSRVAPRCAFRIFHSAGEIAVIGAAKFTAPESARVFSRPA